MSPQGDMPSHLGEPPDGRGRSAPAGAGAGATIASTSGAGASSPRPLLSSLDPHATVRNRADEVVSDGSSAAAAASAYRSTTKRVSIKLPDQRPLAATTPSPTLGGGSPPTRGARTFVFPMRSVFRGRRSRAQESDSDPMTSGAEGSRWGTTGGTVVSDSARSARSGRSGRSARSSTNSSHPARDEPRVRIVPGLVDPTRTDTSTFSTIHSMLGLTSKPAPIGGGLTTLTPFDDGASSYLLPLPQTPVIPLSAVPRSQTPSGSTLSSDAAQDAVAETPRLATSAAGREDYLTRPPGTASDGGTEQAGSNSEVALTIDAPTPTLPIYPAPQSVGSSIAHVMASTAGTGVTGSSDSPVSAQVTNPEPTPTAMGSGSGSGSRTAVAGSQLTVDAVTSGGAMPRTRHSSARAMLGATRKSVQMFVDDQSMTTNMLDPNAPTPRSGAYVPDAAALRRLEGMDRGVRQGLLTSGAFKADEDDRDWAFYERSTTSVSVRESAQGCSGDEGSITKEPITTVRYEHIDTGDGHLVLTGREGRILRCEDEPIRTPGTVQGFGVLMVLEERESGRLAVRQVSENATELLGLSPRYLFRLDCFTRILTPDQAEILRDNTWSLADAPPSVFLLSGFGEQGSDDTQGELSGSQSYRRREWTCWVAAHRPRVHTWRKTDSKGRKLPPPDLIILEFELEHDKYNPLMPEEIGKPKAADSGESDLPSTLSSGLQNNSGKASSGERRAGSVRFSVGANSYDDEEYQRWVNSTTNYAKPLPSLERMRRSGGSRRGSHSRQQQQPAQPTRGGRSRVGMLDAFAVLNQISQQMGDAKDLDVLFKIIVGVVQDLTSYHRVMLYRFDEAYNGEVVAELVDPTRDVDLYNGHWFPATDIPPQARALYTVNKVRFLYDRSQTTARMVLKERADLAYPLDMTQCFLRALSPIHLQYLKNMGVQASLSISVMAFGKLWGLVCCQSVGEHGMRTSFPIRQLLRVLSDTMSLNIERLTYAERLSVRRLITSMPNDSPVPGYIMSNADDLLSYFDADAGMLVINDGCKLLGKVEHAHAMLAIAEYLRISRFQGIRASSCIEVDHPDLILPGATDKGSISGLLYVPLTARAGQDFLVFFRKGQLREVRWAGNPYKPAYADPSAQLQPRKSFQSWAEKVHGRARPWSDDQVESAGILALIYGKFIQVWRERQNAMVSSQLTAILLSNTSHAVRTPLSQIINTLELALAGNIDDETRAMLENSHQASRALMFHVHDLLDLTRIEPGNETGFNDPFDLKQTMQDTVRLYRTEASRRGLEFRVDMGDGLPTMVIGDARKIKTIVSNLVANSVKFTDKGYIEVAARLQQPKSRPQSNRAPSHQGSSRQESRGTHDDSSGSDQGVSASADTWSNADSTRTTKAVTPPDGFVAIEIIVSDSGCGIPPEQLEAMFVALEGAEDWANPEGAGLGLGLAVVARITEQLQGQLCVESEVQAGTHFFLTLIMEVYTGDLPTPQGSDPPGLNDFDIPALGAGDLLMGASTPNTIPATAPAATTPLRPGPETPPTPLGTEAGPSPSHINAQRRLTPRNPTNFAKHLPLLSPDLMKQGQQTMGTLPKPSPPDSPGTVHVTERRLSVGAASFIMRSSDRSPAVSGGPQGNYFDRRVSSSSPPTSARKHRFASSPQVSPSLEGLPPAMVYPKVFSRTNSGSSTGSIPGSKRLSKSSLGTAVSVPPPPPTRSKRGPKGNQQLRVLVVEDDLINSQILQRRLRMDKHTVIAVENGQQAVDALRADWDIDAVLMDIQMPIMDGKTAASEIRKQEAKLPPGRTQGINPLLVDGRIPIFAVSASLYEEDRAGLARNFDGWLLKPLEFGRVRKLLSALEDTDKRRDEVYSPGNWERGGYFRGPSPEATPNGTPIEAMEKLSMAAAATMLVAAATFRRPAAQTLTRALATSARLRAGAADTKPPPRVVLGVPVNLVTVNRSPERARSVLTEVIDRVQDKYTIKYGGNIDTIEGLRPFLISNKHKPGILFCASMWSKEEQDEIIAIAHEMVPGIRTHAIPPGLWDASLGGRENVLNYIMEQIDNIMASTD
ncbi:Phytochrome-like protein cph1 [Vanrija pseudolonga]|uniref:Phytochrome-like protein cph1 n=1 Tax=Vanrija pseudolonga TaxID=143232 RepID=A0AAF0Y582_9TREE|nr:Phytochrome-like protein cph1 [Vanrija pseudolonga]